MCKNKLIKISYGKELRSVVENFHLMTDKQFTSYLENQYFIKVDENKKRVKDISKINDPINMVKFI